jgi:hypothetical protein
MSHCCPFALIALLACTCAPSHVVESPLPMAGDRIRFAFADDSARVHVARVVEVSADTIVVERVLPGMTGGAAERTSASLATASLARLEKRVARRGNAGRGALIGAGVGVVVGFLCANEEPGWLTPTPAQCMIGYPLSGAATGALIGALIRSDVWMPIVRPVQAPGVAGDPAVSAGLVEIGVRVRLRGPSRDD